jgi:hypothetical protein
MQFGTILGNQQYAFILGLKLKSPVPAGCVPKRSKELHL